MRPNPSRKHQDAPAAIGTHSAPNRPAAPHCSALQPEHGQDNSAETLLSDN